MSGSTSPQTSFGYGNARFSSVLCEHEKEDNVVCEDDDLPLLGDIHE
jgi:hypothetical protein